METEEERKNRLLTEAVHKKKGPDWMLYRLGVGPHPWRRRVVIVLGICWVITCIYLFSSITYYLGVYGFEGYEDSILLALIAAVFWDMRQGR